MNITDAVENVGRPVAYYSNIARWLGSVGDAIFLCQLLYWYGKGKDPAGWIYKTQKECEEETALSRYEQEHARRKLKSLGILEEERRGVPAKLYYRLNVDKMNELYAEWYQTQINTEANQNAVNQQSRLLKSSNLDCGKPTNLIAENSQSITENTTEITTEITTDNKDIYTFQNEIENNENEDILEILNRPPIKRKEDKVSGPKLDAVQRDRFEEFWKLYPRKRNKYDAMQVWSSLNPDDELFEAIMAGLKRAVNSKEWKEQEGRFIPYPATWLRKSRWLDEYTEDEIHFDRFEYMMNMRKGIDKVNI